MINWAEHADLLVAHLKATVGALNSVLHIRELDTENDPVVLPCAYVVMGNTTFADAGNGRVDGLVVWQVLVRSKHVNGLHGSLRLSQLALESLAGFRLADGIAPLVPVSNEYFREDWRPEPAYLLTLTTTATQLPSSLNPC